MILHLFLRINQLNRHWQQQQQRQFQTHQQQHQPLNHRSFQQKRADYGTFHRLPPHTGELRTRDSLLAPQPTRRTSLKKNTKHHRPSKANQRNIKTKKKFHKGKQQITLHHQTNNSQIKYHPHLNSYSCLLFITTLLLLSNIETCVASGKFELKLMSYSNSRNELFNGTCCPKPPSRTDRSRTFWEMNRSNCSDPCDVIYRICLKEHQTRISVGGRCTFGNVTSTRSVRSNSIEYADDDNSSYFQLVFDFAWTRSFTLIIEARHQVHDFRNSKSQSEDSYLIESAHYSGVIHPRPEWQTMNFAGHIVHLKYKIRVQCDPHHFNVTCTKFCRPRNDTFGHYFCDMNGDKVCLDGWVGANCETAVCKPGCVHGTCSNSGECICSNGWEGELCGQCSKHPGCKHGTCRNKPWECYCEPNWGGPFCDKDLNYCGRHTPCMNGGLCINKAPDEYHCQCPLGFDGINCEIVRYQACSKRPCQNGGSCVQKGVQLLCQCAEGWTGEMCQINDDECLSNPCLHGGTCIDGVAGYQCLCSPSWQGNHCQEDADECINFPCVNARSCQNVIGGYVCHCFEGWTGKNCDFSLYGCESECYNEGKCMKTEKGYRCVCKEGFTGNACEFPISKCSSQPCQNFGKCIDTTETYNCLCDDGYSGSNCQFQKNPCTPNPCHNESPCYVRGNTFHCDCSDCYFGQLCSLKSDNCDQQTVEDTCVVSTSPTSSSSCGKHGSCVRSIDGKHKCACEAGYSGLYCHENINDCASNPCTNDGTCVDGVNSFQCICSDGWEGLLCNINQNDCLPNPCRNGGSCIDMVAGFKCLCTEGWKGRTCSSKSSHCDSQSCLSGGTCVELQDTFKCLCPSHLHGTICQLVKTSSCQSNPCQNGATCVNSGDTFTCLCVEGFTGTLCDINVNDCNPYPCYNNGHCVDGVNWFQCKCLDGFTGHDCKTVAEDSSLSSKSCLFQSRMYAHNFHWTHDCNACLCQDGTIVCTKIWCGPNLCHLTLPTTSTNSTTYLACDQDEICVVQPESKCFTPPCSLVGECRHMINFGQSKMISSSDEGVINIKCKPNLLVTSRTCIRMMITFNRQMTPLGVTVEDVCRILRNISASQRMTTKTVLVILCDVQLDDADTIEVTFSFLEPHNLPEDEVIRSTQHSANIIEDIIRKRQTNWTLLTSVVKVKLEEFINEEGNGVDMPVYLIPLITTIIILVGVIAIIFLVLWHRRFVKICRQKKEQADVLMKTDAPPNNDSEISSKVNNLNNSNTSYKGGSNSQRELQPLNRHHNQIHVNVDNELASCDNKVNWDKASCLKSKKNKNKKKNNLDKGSPKIETYDDSPAQRPHKLKQVNKYLEKANVIKNNNVSSSSSSSSKTSSSSSSSSMHENNKAQNSGKSEDFAADGDSEETKLKNRVLTADPKKDNNIELSKAKFVVGYDIAV